MLGDASDPYWTESLGPGTRHRGPRFQGTGERVSQRAPSGSLSGQCSHSRRRDVGVRGRVRPVPPSRSALPVAARQNYRPSATCFRCTAVRSPLSTLNRCITAGGSAVPPGGGFGLSEDLVEERRWPLCHVETGRQRARRWNTGRRPRWRSGPRHRPGPDRQQPALPDRRRSQSSSPGPRRRPCWRSRSPAASSRSSAAFVRSAAAA